MAIGTAAAIGLGLTAAGTGMSFSQASKQRKKQSEAEAAATKAMQEAKKKLEINYYKGLGINREPYELERDALLSQGTSLVQAGVESERGAGAVAGRVQMAQNEGQRKIAGAMGEEIQDINKMIASEDARLNNLGLNLDLATAQGAQLASANYETMANQSLSQGLAGVSSLGGQVLAAAPLYAKTNNQKQLGKLQEQYNASIKNGTLDPKYMVDGKPMPFNQALMLKTGNQGTDPTVFNEYMLGQDKKYYKPLFESGFGMNTVNLPNETYTKPIIYDNPYDFSSVTLNNQNNNW